MVYNAELIDCKKIIKLGGKIKNSDGEWVQCLIKMFHKEKSGKIISKNHIV